MRGLRDSAWLIVAAALLPLLLFLFFQVGYSAREQRRAIETRALAASQTAILAADARVASTATAVEALATAQSLRSLDEFRARAAEIAGLAGDWRGVSLIDPATRRAIATIGTDPTRIVPRDRRIAESQVVFAGYAWGTGCPCLVFERATKPVAGRPLLLRVLVAAEPFVRLLPSTKSEYPVSAIVGPQGSFIARTVGFSERFGEPASQYVRAAVHSGKRQGLYRGFTLEGMENYSAFTRSDLTAWSAHLALGSEYIDTPARRYLASLGFATFVSLLLAGLLILFAVRQLRNARMVTERMQQAQKLEALGQLTGGIAHDFNNLLTPIVGALDFLSKKPELDARSRRLADGALSAARRAGRLTGQLLTFSRRQKLQIGVTPLDAVLSDLADLVEQSVDDTHRVTVTKSRDGLCVRSDANQLELALLNLVINARDASPEGSTIAVAAREEGEWVHLSVTDQGSGMDEETRRRAIEPFFSTKAVGRGTGLGLSQVYAVAEQSGGRLDIVSAPGSGTTVTISLRLCAPEEQGDARSGAEVAEPSPAAGRTRRLLVVDDEPAVRAAVARPLEEAGYWVDSVSDGPTALAALAQRRFELVLVDFAMPEMDGATVIREGRKIAPDARFLMVTGFADSDTIADRAPGVPVLKKPFEPDELVRMVQSLIEP